MPAYTDEDKQKTLLSGAPLHFPSDVADAERIVRPEWILEAVRGGVPVDVDNAVLTAPLNLQTQEIPRPFAVTNSRIRGLNLADTAFAQAVRFDGAVVEGGAMLDGARFGRDPRLRGTHFEGEASFLRVDVGGAANFNKAVFKQTAILDYMHVGGDFLCSWTTFGGKASGLNVHIEGRACFVKTLFKQAKFDGMTVGAALNGSRAAFGGIASFAGVRIGGRARWAHAAFRQNATFVDMHVEADLICNRATYEGAATFVGVKIGGQAQWTHAAFRNAATFDSMVVEADLICNRATYEGVASFIGVRVGGQAQWTHAAFRQDVIFDEMSVGADFFCDPTTFNGKASFQLLQVGGDFTCTCRFPKEADLSGCSIGGTLDCRKAAFENKWNLRGARITTFLIDGELGERPPLGTKGRFLGGKASVDLRGLTCGQIQVYLLPFLERQYPYDRQPYTEFERAMRRNGRDDFGDAIYYRRRQLEGNAIRPSEARPWTERFWGNLLRFIGDRFLRGVAGYGVRPWRMLVFVMLFPVLGWLAFYRLEGAAPKPPSNAEGSRATPCQNLSWQDAAWLSIRTYLPFEIPSASEWVVGDCPLRLPGNGALGNGTMLPIKASSLASLLKIASLIFIPTAVATFTGLLRYAGSTN